MISYDDLCHALDRWNQKRQNAAEMTALEGGDQPALAAAQVAEVATDQEAIALEPAVDAIIDAPGTDDVLDAASDESVPLEGEPTQISPMDATISDPPDLSDAVELTETPGEAEAGAVTEPTELETAEAIVAADDGEPEDERPQ